MLKAMKLMRKVEFKNENTVNKKFILVFKKINTIP